MYTLGFGDRVTRDLLATSSCAATNQYIRRRHKTKHLPNPFSETRDGQVEDRGDMSFVFNAAAVCLCAALAATLPPSEEVPMAAVDVEFPFLVGLMTAGQPADNVTVVCTGTLVTPVFVLSSAYCASRLRTGIEASNNPVAPESRRRN